MNRFFSSLFCLFLFLSRVGAQEKILLASGIIVDSKNGEPIAGVMTTATSMESSTILAYMLTGADGKFQLLGQTNDNQISLTGSSMMTHPFSMDVSVGSENLIIKVEKATLTLEEVKVTASKATMKGDTIDFNVASYLTEADKSIGDVIKKLPGLKVDDLGRIYYQGQEISNFYVENMDLLKGRYGLATKNISPDMIASVQVLQNHQPIKVLKNVELPEDAAINLKLKTSSAGAWFVNAQLGVGGPKISTSNELIGMRFSKNKQDMYILKNDSSGKDISKELISFYGSAVSSILNPFTIGNAQTTLIDEKHYLFNNAYVASANNLRPLGKNYFITSNISFLFDNQKSFSSLNQMVFLPDRDDVNIIEDNTFKFAKRELATTISIERNDAEKYVSNRTEANLIWNDQSSCVSSRTDIFQNLIMPSFSIENHFKSMGGNNRWSSNIAFSNQSNSFSISPMRSEIIELRDTIVTQKYDYGHLNADVSYSKSISSSRRFNMRITSGVAFKHDNVMSKMYDGNLPITIDSLVNNLSWDELDIVLGTEVRYNWKSVSFSALTPMSMAFIQGKAYFVPKVTSNLEYNRSRMTYRIDFAFSKGMPGINDAQNGYIFKSYRSLSRSSGILPFSNTATIKALVAYKSLNDGLFANLSGGYVRTGRNTLTNLIYDNEFCRSYRIEYHNSVNTLWAGLDASFSIPILRSSLKVEMNYTDNLYTSLAFGLTVGCRSDVIMFKPSIIILPGRLFTIDYAVDYSFCRSSYGNVTTWQNHNLHQILKVVFSPIKKLDIECACDSYQNSMEDFSGILFGSCSLCYKTKKVEYRLDWTNIFNNRNLYTIRYDDISRYCTSVMLRPTEILASVKFKIW